MQGKFFFIWKVCNWMERPSCKSITQMLSIADFRHPTIDVSDVIYGSSEFCAHWIGGRVRNLRSIGG